MTKTEDGWRGRGVATCSVNLDEAIVSSYAERVARPEPYSLVDSPDPNVCTDVTVEFFYQSYEEDLPADISERCALVQSVLETEKVSLSLAALLWRTVQEPLFDAGAEQTYSTEERLAIRQALGALKNKAELWRLMIFDQYLDPYLVGGRESLFTSVVSKAGPKPGEVEEECLREDQNKERWCVGEDPDTWEAALAYFVSHSYAEQMDLELRFVGAGSMTIYSGDDVRYEAASDMTASSHYFTIGPFDVIVPYDDVSVRFEVKGNSRIIPSYDSSEAVFMEDADTDDEMSKTLRIALEGDREYTYVEILNAVFEAHRLELGAMGASWIVGEPVSLWGDDEEVVVAIHQNGALLWPAFREAKETGAFDVARSRDVSGVETVTLDSTCLRRVLLKDIDFWMF